MPSELPKLENQLCFPLYVCAKEMVRRYKPLLDGLDLTYTQYITMMVLWQQSPMGVKALGEHLYLDSGTLTPVLKKLEQKGYQCEIQVQNDKKKVDFVEDFLKQDLPSTGRPRRYSFDMRA